MHILPQLKKKVLGGESRKPWMSLIYSYPSFHSSALSLFGVEQWFKCKESEAKLHSPHTPQIAVYLGQYERRFSVPFISSPVKWE